MVTHALQESLHRLAVNRRSGRPIQTGETASNPAPFPVGGYAKVDRNAHLVQWARPFPPLKVGRTPCGCHNPTRLRLRPRASRSYDPKEIAEEPHGEW